MIMTPLQVMRSWSAEPQNGEKFVTLDGQERTMDDICSDDL